MTSTNVAYISDGPLEPELMDEGGCMMGSHAAAHESETMRAKLFGKPTEAVGWEARAHKAKGWPAVKAGKDKLITGGHKGI